MPGTNPMTVPTRCEEGSFGPLVHSNAHEPPEILGLLVVRGMHSNTIISSIVVKEIRYSEKFEMRRINLLTWHYLKSHKLLQDPILRVDAAYMHNHPALQEAILGYCRRCLHCMV